MKRSGPPKRRKPLAARSARTIERAAERRDVVASAERRDRGCALAGYSPCRRPRAGHEILRRSAMKGTAYELRFVVTLCGAHHAIDDDDPRLAERLGIRIPRWAWDQYGEPLLAECAALRESARNGHVGRASWR